MIRAVLSLLTAAGLPASCPQQRAAGVFDHPQFATLASATVAAFSLTHLLHY
jgi:hypothetical protein